MWSLFLAGGAELILERSDAEPSGDMDKESALVKAVAQWRDRDALAALLQKYELAAFNLAFHITRDQEAAKEAVQTSMLCIWQSAHLYRSESSARGWILQTIARESLKVIRSRIKGAQRMERDKDSQSHAKQKGFDI